MDMAASFMPFTNPASIDLTFCRAEGDWLGKHTNLKTTSVYFKETADFFVDTLFNPIWKPFHFAPPEQISTLSAPPRESLYEELIAGTTLMGKPTRTTSHYGVIADRRPTSRTDIHPAIMQPNHGGSVQPEHDENSIQSHQYALSPHDQFSGFQWSQHGNENPFIETITSPTSLASPSAALNVAEKKSLYQFEGDENVAPSALRYQDDVCEENKLGLSLTSQPHQSRKRTPFTVLRDNIEDMPSPLAEIPGKWTTAVPSIYLRDYEDWESSFPRVVHTKGWARLRPKAPTPIDMTVINAADSDDPTAECGPICRDTNQTRLAATTEAVVPRKVVNVQCDGENVPNAPFLSYVPLPPFTPIEGLVPTAPMVSNHPLTPHRRKLLALLNTSSVNP